MYLIFVIKTLFSMWMIADLSKRKLPFYWNLIIILPFGAVYYFFKHKIHDPSMAPVANYFGVGSGLEKLRLEFEHCPSEQTHIKYGFGLFKEGEIESAKDVFQEILTKNGDCLEAVHGLALCHYAQNDLVQAIALLEPLCRKQPKFSEYSAAGDLCAFYLESDRIQDAIELLEKLEGISGRVEHAYKLAVLYSKADRQDDAKRLLRRILSEDEQSPDFARNYSREWVKKADKKLAALS